MVIDEVNWAALPEPSQLSALALIHWFCVDKNMPVSDEKVLLKLLAHPMLNINVDNFSVNKIWCDLQQSVPTISYSLILCRKKSKKEVNIKPIDPAVFTGFEGVNVYSVRDHLSLFLKNKRLSDAVIFIPVSNTVGYTSFVSGQYFHSLVQNLPVGLLPLCCMEHLHQRPLLTF